jgi:rare lipoprotein A
LRPSPSPRTAPVTCALSLAITAASAVPVAASPDQGTGGTAAPSGTRVDVGTRQLEVRLGRRAIVGGSVLPRTPGMRALLQVRRGSRWHTLDHDRTGAHGRYALRRRLRAPMSARARVLLRDHGTSRHRGVGRLNVYRTANASWYGPGLYGNHLGCGGRLGYRTLGVAHKTLPCGTRLTLRHAGRVLRVRVIDRGPFVTGREFDLTAATAQRLHFHGHGGILVTR